MSTVSPISSTNGYYINTPPTPKDSPTHKGPPGPPPNTPVSIQRPLQNPFFYSVKTTKITTTEITTTMDVEAEKEASKACCIIC